VPFRGEYHRLAPAAAALVRGLVYPVPDPRYPFLGVHLTRTLSGEVLAGPNAVLATALDGYRRRDFSARELAGVLAFPGTRRLFAAHWRAGLAELRTSLSRRAYAAKVRDYLPALSTADLEPAPAGVRAQVLDRAGALVDDFVIETSGRVTVVRNAPSPAATSSLAIAAHLVGELEGKGQFDVR
jgi:L-2-hydroxyglutarate oxidase LhgO